MWSFRNKNIILTIFCVSFISADWVEIPQFSSNRKSYLVTPYTPYIYQQSSVFPSTTPTPYFTMFEPRPHKPTFIEEKKSITKLPDVILKNNLLTTEIPPSKKPPLKLPHFKNLTSTSIKTSNRMKLNSKLPSNKRYFSQPTETPYTTTMETPTTTPYIPKINQIIMDEQEFDEKQTFNEDGEDEYEYVEDEDETENDYEDERDFDGDDEEAEEIGDDYYDDTEYEEDDEEQPATQKGSNSYTTNGFSYVSFVPYLQNIQSTLIKNSHKTPKSKISFLIDIKDRLLHAIKQKIASIWPSSSKRQARSARGDHYDKGNEVLSTHGHESALLTLSFLTFATFLVKAILKLIHHLKQDKYDHQHHYGYGNNVVPIFFNGTTFQVGRRKREALNEKATEILNLIDKYKNSVS